MPNTHLEETTFDDEFWHFHREERHKATQVLVLDKARTPKIREVSVSSSELAKRKDFQALVLSLLLFSQEVLLVDSKK